jgi:hypothetical protein
VIGEGKRHVLRLNIERWVLCLTYSGYKAKEGRKSRTKKKARTKIPNQIYKNNKKVI